MNAIPFLTARSALQAGEDKIPAVFPGWKPSGFTQCCHADPLLPSGSIGEAERQTERKKNKKYLQAHKHPVRRTSQETGADSSSIPVQSVTQPGLVNKTGETVELGIGLEGVWGSGGAVERGEMASRRGDGQIQTRLEM